MTHTLTGCVNNGTVTSTGNYAAGMYCISYKTIVLTNCHNTGDITANYAAGGMIARPMDAPSLTLKGCTNSGNIKSKGAGSAGGLIGSVHVTYDITNGSSRPLTIENCHNSGNVTLELAKMEKNEGVGGLIGILQSRVGTVTVKNCSNSGTITATITERNASLTLGLGGAIGLIPATVNDGTRTVTVSKIDVDGFTNSGTINYTAGAALVGGVLGYIIPTGDLTVSVNNAVNTANLTSKSMNLGGVVGHIQPTGKADVTITNCRNSGTITSTASNVAVGGILGGGDYLNSLTITNCINTGDVISAAGRPGGILGVTCGSNKVTIKNCTNMGKIDSNGNYPGGIASRIDAKTTLMEDCVNYGTVEAHQSQAGGMVGYMSVDGGLTRADCETTFKNCENHGTVTVGNANAVWLGGIVGSYNNGDLTIDSCTNYGFIGTTIKATLAILALNVKSRTASTAALSRSKAPPPKIRRLKQAV